MEDTIYRQAAIDALEREKTYCTAFRDGYTPINVFEKYNDGLTDGIKALKNLPSAQPDIVRCENCKHSEYDAMYGDRYCHHNGKAEIVPDNHYCGYGERRTDGV